MVCKYSVRRAAEPRRMILALLARLVVQHTEEEVQIQQPHSTSTTPGPVSNYFPLYPGGSDTRNPNAPRQRCHEGPPVIPGGQPAVDRCGVSSVRVNPARAGNRKRNPARNNKTASRPPQNCRQRRLRKISNTTAAASAPQHSLP